MERDDILRSVGFSDDFLQHLHAFEKAVPEIHLEPPFDVSEDVVNLEDRLDQVNITAINADYSQNLIIRQA